MPSAPREPILESVAANVRRNRMRRGLSQEQLAEALELREGERYIQRVESGQINLGIVMLARLADVLGVKPGTLLSEAELPPRKRGRPKGTGRKT